MLLRSTLVAVLRKLGLYHLIRDWRRDWRFRRLNAAKIRTWHAAGRPMPAPDLLKYGVIRQLARRHRTLRLVETGTFYGNAIFTLRHEFQEIHSVELAPSLYELNCGELGHLDHIHLHLGDSAEVIPRLLPTITTPTLFWLDGHFCAGPSARANRDTPICSELEHLLSQPPGQHVVLIDDARLFVGKDGYPSIEELREIIRQRRPEAAFTVETDIIRIVPI